MRDCAVKLFFAGLPHHAECKAQEGYGAVRLPTDNKNCDIILVSALTKRLRLLETQ